MCTCVFVFLCVTAGWVRVSIQMLSGSGACWGLALVGHVTAPGWTLLPLPGTWVLVGLGVRDWMWIVHFYLFLSPHFCLSCLCHTIPLVM